MTSVELCGLCAAGTPPLYPREMGHVPRWHARLTRSRMQLQSQLTTPFPCPATGRIGRQPLPRKRPLALVTNQARHARVSQAGFVGWGKSVWLL